MDLDRVALDLDISEDPSSSRVQTMENLEYQLAVQEDYLAGDDIVQAHDLLEAHYFWVLFPDNPTNSPDHSQRTHKGSARLFRRWGLC